MARITISTEDGEASICIDGTPVEGVLAYKLEQRAGDVARLTIDAIGSPGGIALDDVDVHVNRRDVLSFPPRPDTLAGLATQSSAVPDIETLFKQYMALGSGARVELLARVGLTNVGEYHEALSGNSKALATLDREALARARGADKLREFAAAIRSATESEDAAVEQGDETGG